MKQPKKPEWTIKLIRNAKARERYFIKRYGSLDRMHDIEYKRLQWCNEDSMRIELDECDHLNNTNQIK